MFAPAADKAAASVAAAASTSLVPPFVLPSLVLKRLVDLSIYVTEVYPDYYLSFLLTNVLSLVARLVLVGPTVARCSRMTEDSEDKWDRRVYP